MNIINFTIWWHHFYRNVLPAIGILSDSENCEKYEYKTENFIYAKEYLICFYIFQKLSAMVQFE